MFDPIVCADCPAEFTPRTSNTKRCPTCAAARAKRGSAKRPSKRRRVDGGRPGRNAVLLDRPWWGIDGEGVNFEHGGIPHGRHGERADCDCDHGYVFMAADCSDGRTNELWRGGARLETADILSWLWHLGKPGDLYAFYGSGYDWCHILRDLSAEDLIHVYKPEQVFDITQWGSWKISNLRNAVTIAKPINGRGEAEMFFCDMFRVAGCGPFVNFIDKWKTGTADEREHIAAMKLQRGRLGEIDSAKVREYCHLETRHLAEGAAKLWQALVGLDIVPNRSRLYSAGSLARRLFHNYGVPAYRGEGRYGAAPEELVPILQSGYFGSRFELAEPGPHERLHKYDLNSAFPAIMVDLPCLAHGHWEHRTGPPAPIPLADALSRPEIVHIRWDLNPGWYGLWPKWGPLPYRWPNGKVWCQARGAGWYWRAEAVAATQFREFAIDQIESWTWVQECDHKPFEFVPKLYEQRLALGKDAKGLALKVAMNSCYGVTADSVSEESPFASPTWAGLTTSGCRALVAEQLAAHGADIAEVAADSVSSRTEVLPADTSKRLGAWGYEGIITDAFLVQPGFGFWTKDGEDQQRTRGISVQELRLYNIKEQARHAWWHHGWHGEVAYSRERLIPPKLALTRENPKADLGQWRPLKASIKFLSPKRHPTGDMIPVGHGVSHVKNTRPDLPDSAPYRKLVELEEVYENARDLAHFAP